MKVWCGAGLGTVHSRPLAPSHARAMPHPSPMTADQAAARRKAVRRTALAVAAIAVGVYVVFILSGVLGQ